MSFKKNKLLSNKLISLFILIWLLFTFALLSWWIIFSYRQLEALSLLNLQSEPQILKYQKMLIYEGITLFLCLILGASVLIFLVYRENIRLKERRDFLSSFTHDLKTTITTLRLKMERLLKSTENSKQHQEAKEIQSIGTRLNQQLQNALQVSYQDQMEVFIEKINLSQELDYIKALWPDLSFEIEDKIFVRADRALLRTVLSNIIQNAVDHGQASALKVYSLKEKASEKVGALQVVFESLGAVAFEGNLESFSRSLVYKRSVDSSGLGLKISKKILQSFDAELKFDQAQDKSLKVLLEFKEAQA